MTFHGIAYGPDDHVLLTFDGADVLAHDAQTEAPKWHLTLPRPVVAVLFANASALPGCEGPNPWRQASAGRCVVAVDAEGGLHAIDPALGHETGKLGPFGRPVSVAAAGGLFALATEDKVCVWRGGERMEIPGRGTSAIAFSNDGVTLAIGARDGSLRFLSVAASPPVETFCAVVHGGINDLVQHPDGAWVVCGKSGVSTVTDAGPQRLPNLPSDVLRVRLDANGRRLAAQLSDRTIAVYAFPSLETEMRIEYMERLVRGLSFGPGNWLGVALDHGDGNKIDVVTSATHRTDTHPGRTHRSWLLSVRGKETILSAKEAEEIRQMKAPFHVPAPTKANGGGAGGRVGIGVAISVALLGLRLCVASSRSSSYPTTYPTTAYDPITSPALGATCDRACATRRLEMLSGQCSASNLACAADADEAVTALAAGNCKRARTAVARISRWPVTKDSSDVLGNAMLSLATKGLDEACVANAPHAAAKHARLVRLSGPTLEVTTESIPEASPTDGEEPRALWAAPDGTVFVATMLASHTSSHVHRRSSKTGTWDVIARRRTTMPAHLWGRSATDLYVLDGDSLAHFDGLRTTEITPPAPDVSALAGVGEDVFVIGESTGDAAGDAGDAGPQLHRRQGGVAGKWLTEPTVAGLGMREIWSGGGSLWGRAVPSDGSEGTDDRLLVRSSGRWTEKKWFGAVRPGTVDIHTVWVSPTSDAFVATNAGVFRSANGGASWTKTGEPADVEALWGRSNGDVYAITPGGLWHYDGKKWSATSYTQHARVIGGTATDVILGLATDD